jgi:hypothetical protein
MVFCLCLASSINARTIPDPTDATGFFTTVADKLLRSTFNFGITNIPVQTNGVFCYTPAVQRLLQLTANLRDAANTNFYPTVYRPILYNDGQGKIYITGYQQVTNVSGPADPQLGNFYNITHLPVGVSSNVNVYGVPWIIGVKKYMPNFNTLYSYDTVQVTRQVQVSRPTGTTLYTRIDSSLFATNQMFVLSITNHIGFSFWNSYANSYPGGAPTVVANCSVIGRISQTNGSLNQTVVWIMPTFAQTLSSGWPGTGIPANSSAVYLAPYSGSFIAGVIDFPVFPQASLVLDNNGVVTAIDPIETFVNATATTLPNFPALELDTTNYFQGFILDGTNVIDYVQFAGPNQTRMVNNDLQDFNYAGGTAHYMWSTNKTISGVNYGVQNQIYVSETDQDVPTAAQWTAPPNMPVGFENRPQEEAAFFFSFFTGTPVTYNGVTYYNTNLIAQAPYVPSRTVTSPVLWLANDPLVHYLAPDLNDPISPSGSVTGAYQYDGGAITFPFPNLSSPAQIKPLSQRFQPWEQSPQMDSLYNVDTNAYNFAYRDPLIWTSDNWNFPATNSLPLTTLGQVHRGTPWQTVYLKATNILGYSQNYYGNPSTGLNTWMYWTGDTNSNDASIMAPVSDWRLAALLAEMFNTNDATQLASVNAANWPVLLDGTTVLTNSVSPAELDSVVMSSNSPQATVIATALSQAQAGEPNGVFESVGDIIGVPILSQSSPWLDVGAQNEISDAAYEAIPSQLLLELRPDSTGAMSVSNGVFNVQFTGADAFDYAVQVSTNLLNWRTVGTNSPHQGTFPLPVCGSRQQLYYRTVLLP